MRDLKFQKPIAAPHQILSTSDPDATFSAAHKLPTFSYRHYSSPSSSDLKLTPFPSANIPQPCPITRRPQPAAGDTLAAATHLLASPQWAEALGQIKGMRRDETHQRVRNTNKFAHRTRSPKSLLIDDALDASLHQVLDLSNAFRADGSIDPSLICPIDDGMPPVSQLNIRGIRKLQDTYPQPDLDIIDQLTNGINNDSTCLLSTRLHKNHGGALLYPDKITEYIEGETKAGRMSGPYATPATWPFVSIPLNTVVQPKPDGSNKYRITSDFSESKAPYSINAGIDLHKEPPHLMVRLLLLAQAVAILQAFGLKPYLWGLDGEAYYRQLPKAKSELWQQNYFWKGAFWRDHRAAFGDAVMVHKATRLSNMLVHFVRGEQRDRHRKHVQKSEFKEYASFRLQHLGFGQELLAFIIMFIDDMLGVSASEELAHEDLKHAVDIMQSQAGMPVAPKKIQPPTRRLDGLGGCIDADKNEVGLTKHFIEKLKVRTSQVLDATRPVECKKLEKVVYSQSYVSLFHPELKSEMHISFALMKATLRGGRRFVTITSAPFHKFSQRVINTAESGRRIPLCPALRFPAMGHEWRVDIESDASSEIGFGSICLPSNPDCPIFYIQGLWSAAERDDAFHINLKEQFTTLL